MGHIAGTNAARLARGEEPITMPQGTMMGALAHYITTKEGTLQPINSNWGLVPAVPKKENGRRITKPERRQRQARMALAALEGFLNPGGVGSRWPDRKVQVLESSYSFAGASVWSAASRMVSTSFSKEMPAASAARGKVEVSVKPGMVLTSRT